MKDSSILVRGGLGWLLAAAGTAVVSLVALWPAAAARSPHRAVPALAPARAKSADASAFERDKGTLRILVNGQQVGKENFEISPDGGNWTARGVTEIHDQKSTTRVTGTLVLHADGTPVHYEWSTEGTKKASAQVDFKGPVVTSQLQEGKARPFMQQFTFSSPRIAILDNNLYDQYAVLAHLYDWNKKGAQTFPVLVPQELTPGSATVESMGAQDVDGKQLDELKVTTQDNEVDVFLEGSRLMRISVPSANAEIVRQ